MNDNNATRLKLLKIWEIIRDESDKDNPISTVTIMNKLTEMGINCTRKTLYRDIELLQNGGYDIQKDRERSNYYYVSSRDFELPELQMLLDAVHASAFLSETREAELVKKILLLAGRYQGELMEKNITIFNPKRNPNKHVFYTLDTIINAINAEKQISFNYFHYSADHDKVYSGDGKPYKKSPLTTCYDDDNYYLICYDEETQKPRHYRIDRIENVNQLNESISSLAKKERRDLSVKKSKVFGMYGGELTNVTFEVDTNKFPKIFDIIFDQFGSSVFFENRGSGIYRFTHSIELSPVFYAWCVQFSDPITVISPERVREEVLKTAQIAMKKYQK